MFAEQPSLFLRDFGVPCSCGAYAFSGILDASDDTLNMGGVNVLSTMYVLQVQASDVAAGAIASGSALLVNGVAYTVRDVLSIDDGVFNHLSLTKG
jgi:hypothetical protein